MKYGLLKYAENKRFFNIGDNIQSLAAKQYLPRVDEYINREELGNHTGDKTKMILNGWFTHNASDWVPSESIDPLFISMHINNTAAPLMLSAKGIAYLKKHEPIGCRDNFTKDLLLSKGIDAYFSGCLTLTLDTYKVEDSERTDEIFIVDPLYGYPTKKKVLYNFKSVLRNIKNGNIFKISKRQRHIKKIIDSETLEKAIYINQEPPAETFTNEQKFNDAEELLNRYARAKLVITSRIHCALPCLAMGTPVIFINGFTSFVDSCRFEGIIDLFNRVDVDSNTGEFTANFPLIDGKVSHRQPIKNFEKHHNLANKMKETCKAFISKDK